MTIVQIAFVAVAIVFVASLAFTLLTIYEQMGICGSRSEKVLALCSSAINCLSVLQYRLYCSSHFSVVDCCKFGGVAIALNHFRSIPLKFHC
jgi:hypothetical protein